MARICVLHVIYPVGRCQPIILLIWQMSQKRLNMTVIICYTLGCYHIYSTYRPLTWTPRVVGPSLFAVFFTNIQYNDNLSVKSDTFSVLPVSRRWLMSSSTAYRQFEEAHKSSKMYLMPFFHPKKYVHFTPYRT